MSHRNRLVLCVAVAGLVLAAGLAAPPVLGAPEQKVAGANEIKDRIKKLFADIEPGSDKDSIETQKLVGEIDGLIAKGDAKTSALKAPAFWVESIQSVRFMGKQHKSANTRVVGKADAPARGTDNKEVKLPFVYWAGASYAPKVASPLLLCIVEKGVDPAAYLKTWTANEEINKNWVIAVIAESDLVDFAKQPVYAAYWMKHARDLFNTDPNRVYLEGVGGAASRAQTVADSILADRIAGLILRNPPEARATDNATLYPTVVVHGAEGADKAKAVFAAYKDAVGDRAVELEAPDTASITGTFPALAEWLKTQTAPGGGRKMPTEYRYSTTFTETAGAPFTGNVWIDTPLVRGKPTKLKVAFHRDTNTVNVESENLDEFRVFMNDELLDLDKEVAIFVNGQQVAKKTFQRETPQMFKFMFDISEFGRVYTASWRGFAPKVEKPPEKAPEKPGDKPADKPGEKPADKPPGDKPPEQPPADKPPTTEDKPPEQKPPEEKPPEKAPEQPPPPETPKEPAK